MQNNRMVLASTMSVGVSSCATRTPEYDLCIDSFDGNPEFISQCAFLLNDPLNDALSSSVMLFSSIFLLFIWLMPIKNWFVNSIAKDIVKSKKPFERWDFLPLFLTALSGYFSINLLDDLLNLKLEKDLPAILSAVPGGLNLMLGKKQK